MVNAWPYAYRDRVVWLLWSLIVLMASTSLGVAWWAQHRWGMEPCAWCVWQRLWMFVLGGWAALGAGLHRWQGWRVRGLWAALGCGVACLGVGAAWYQDAVAAHQLSCALTWPERALMDLGLSERWPDWFEARASCAEAAHAQLLGWPFAAWSGVTFALMASLAGYIGWCAWRDRRGA